MERRKYTSLEALCDFLAGKDDRRIDGLSDSERNQALLIFEGMRVVAERMESYSAGKPRKACAIKGKMDPAVEARRREALVTLRQAAGEYLERQGNE